MGKNENITLNLEPSFSLTRVLVPTLVAALLLVTVGNLWLYFHGTRALQSQFQAQTNFKLNRNKTEEAVSSLYQQLDAWTRNATTSAALGTVGLIVLAGTAFLGLRRVLEARAKTLSRQIDDLNRQIEQAKNAHLRTQVERSRLENELRTTCDDMERKIHERTDTLSKTCAKLEKELNSRRQAEMALTFQAKELERSKDVLELHVQARTQELQKLKSRYELILNSAGEGIYGLDLQGRTTFVNPAAAKLTGWNLEDIIGKTEQEIFYGAQGAPDDSHAGGILVDKDGQHLGEQIFRQKDGSLITVEYVRTPLVEDGRLFGAVVIFKDITERKRADERLAHKASELSRSNAELEQFAYVASHDLQEPLRKIQAFGDRLKTKCRDSVTQEARDYLERMLRAAARMQTLINDLLTFSRVISSTQPFFSVNLTELTHEVLGDLEVRIEQSQAKIHLSDLPTIEADPTQMRQLLQNLVSNALKFSKPGQKPEVHIRAQIQTEPSPVGDTDALREVCVLEIKDNGIGFEERYLDKIFAVFQRLHGRSEYEGTGVGLAVCRRITDRHSGTIGARSCPGDGATFTVTLPVRQPQRKAAE